MSYSYQPHTTSASQTTYTFSFAGVDPGYISGSHISVEVRESGKSEFTTLDSSKWSLSGTNQITLNPAIEAPADGKNNLRIRRVVPKDNPYATFPRGSMIDMLNLDRTFIQMLEAFQEFLDGFLPAGFYFQQNINMNGHKFTNLGPGSASGDSINWDQWDNHEQRIEALESDLTDLSSRTIPYYYIATGGETRWQVPNRLFSTGLLFINGVFQNQNLGAFSITDNGFNFAEPLSKGDEIYALVGSYVAAPDEHPTFEDLDATVYDIKSYYAAAQGASRVGTTSGLTVQGEINLIEADTTIVGKKSIGSTLRNTGLIYDQNGAMWEVGNTGPVSFRSDGYHQVSGVFEGIRIITVGYSDADFTSLNAAIEFASKFKPKYVNSPGYIHYRIEVEIQSGYIVTEQVVARQIDLSHITLTSVDDIVKVNVPTTLWWMYGEFAAHLPIIGTIFDLQGIGFDGLSLKMGSQAIIEYGHVRGSKPSTKYAGIINAARHNIFLNTECRFVGRECVFTGAAGAGVHLEKHCTACVRDADISGNNLFGVRLINGSTADCYGVDVSNTPNGPGIQAEVGSSASGFGINFSNSKQGLRASYGSRLVATTSTFTNMADSDAWVYGSDGSEIIITGATGTGGACVCLVSAGSKVDVQGVDGTASGSSSGNFRCLTGSHISASGTTGTFNKAVNTVDANGIIFK